VQRAELRMLFRRYGCHHCGKRFGKVIADHQPPNKTVYGAHGVFALGKLAAAAG
jgi:CDP-diglyceride synthetase